MRGSHERVHRFDIDSTGRVAHGRGFRVHQLEDCTCGRTHAEQEQYCTQIFPLYSEVVTTAAAIDGVLAVQASGSPSLVCTDFPAFRRSLSAIVDDEVSTTAFNKLCTVDRIWEWLSQHPSAMAQFSGYQDELQIQINHRLMDHAAAKERESEQIRATQNDKYEAAVPFDDQIPEDSPLITFLSHGKNEAGAVARLIKLHLKKLLHVHITGGDDSIAESVPRIFLDSDNIDSLSSLLQHVQEARSFTLLLTETTLYRPWVICEYLTAMQHSVPIMAIIVEGSEFDSNWNDIEQGVSNIEATDMELVSKHCPGTTRESLSKAIKSLLRPFYLDVSRDLHMGPIVMALLNRCALRLPDNIKLSLKIISDDESHKDPSSANSKVLHSCFLINGHSVEGNAAASTLKFLLG